MRENFKLNKALRCLIIYCLIKSVHIYTHKLLHHFICMAITTYKLFSLCKVKEKIFHCCISDIEAV
jgi:hypothetical protein